MGFKECRIVPSQRLCFRGMIVNTEHQALEVPEGAVEALRTLVEELEAAPALTHQQMARVTGKIVAMAVEVSLAPLPTTGRARGLGGGLGEPGVGLDAARVSLRLRGASSAGAGGAPGLRAILPMWPRWWQVLLSDASLWWTRGSYQWRVTPIGGRRPPPLTPATACVSTP
jgi:hypothetical protein